MMEMLPNVSQIATFGCELDFVHPSAHQILKDPMWDTQGLHTFQSSGQKLLRPG